MARIKSPYLLQDALARANRMSRKPALVEEDDPPPSPASQSSLASVTPLALPEASLAREAEPAPEAPERPNVGIGHARMYYDYWDAKIAPLSGYAQLLWTWLNRHRDHGSNVTIVLNWPMLARKTHFSPRQLSRAAVELEETGIAHRFGHILGKGKVQGFRFSLVSQSSLVQRASHDSKASLASQAEKKRNTLKDTNIKATPEEIEEYERVTGRKWEA